VGGKKKILYLVQKNRRPDVAPISLKQAKVKLRKALKDLPNLKPPAVVPAKRTGLNHRCNGSWRLMSSPRRGMDVRPHSYHGRRPTMSDARGPLVLSKAAVKLKPLQLDAMTVADDADFLTRGCRWQKTCRNYIKQGLPLL